MGELLGQMIEVDVTNIAHGGVSVARHDGRVVFVSDAIPGERVLARITDDKKKSFWRAETVKVVTPSEHRQDHVWSAASVDRDPDNRAGGAEFGHIELGHQRELKAQILSEALERMAKVALAPRVEAVPGDDERKG
ncbi:MAG: TRAM domain-containing protein, partial [Rhodoglobus sp.]